MDSFIHHDAGKKVTFDEMPNVCLLIYNRLINDDSYVFLHSILLPLFLFRSYRNAPVLYFFKSVIAIKNGLSVVKFIAKHLPTQLFFISS